MEQGSGTHNPFNRYRRPSKARQKQLLYVKRVAHLRVKEIQIKDSDRLAASTRYVCNPCTALMATPTLSPQPS